VDSKTILHIVTLVLTTLIGLCYAWQIVYLFVPFFLRKKKSAGAVKLHRYGILIAARNEELVLPYLLDSIMGQEYPAELLRVYVVADNCTDRTAQVARSHGADVFERFSTTRVGKGYALHDLLEYIQKSGDMEELDAFLIFDADNLLSPDFITNINTVCAQGYDAFCGFRNSKNYGTNWVSASHALWYLHESAHFNRSRMALGVPCMVSGTGFGFTKDLLDRMGGWNFFTLTEDIQFNTWCAIHGARIGYSHEAVFYDEQPDTLRQSWRQRTRWVQGGIQVSFRYGRALMQGMLGGGRTGYACLEAFSLSIWGYLAGTFCGLLSLFTAFILGGPQLLIHALSLTTQTAILSMLATGLLTALITWRRIHTGFWRKLLGIFALPLFLLTYPVIAVSAVFRKFHWPPIEHKVTVSAGKLYK